MFRKFFMKDIPNSDNKPESAQLINVEANNRKIELYLVLTDAYSGGCIELIDADFYDNYGYVLDDIFPNTSVFAKNIKTKQHYNKCLLDEKAMGIPYLGGIGITLNGKTYHFDLLDECNYEIHEQDKTEFTGVADAAAFPNGFNNSNLQQIIAELNKLFKEFVIVGIVDTNENLTLLQPRSYHNRLSSSDDDIDSTPDWFQKIFWGDDDDDE